MTRTGAPRRGTRPPAARTRVLMLSGVSDYLDGKLARRWNQISSLGRILDP
ncbi:CDP-alcohol phosphatidyltransferase family protein, partial [Streptomyces sp. NPDC047966]|uniref:CDP-alcohol phosphatidyltransferase family protein n=1 Tax=Streptomyces sp. NPDC047966 TaxID=3155745 RepID=UPI003432533A